MKSIYVKIREVLTGKMSKLTAPSKDLPKLIFLSSEIKDEILNKHPGIRGLVADYIDDDNIIFNVSNVPSPFYKDGKLYLGQSDFSNLMPSLLEFFSSHQRGVPISEAFNILIARLSGE